MNFFRLSQLVLVLVSAPLASVVLAQTPASPKGFEAFRMVRTRNIFDPERRPIPTPGAPIAAAVPTRADFVALTGIMVTSDKALAFFSGSRADYSKVLALNGAIAGAKLTKITPASVEVERDGKRVTVAVGQTVPLDGSAPAAAPTAPPDEPAPASVDSISQNPNPPSGNVSDVLRRMMERRQQELK